MNDLAGQLRIRAGYLQAARDYFREQRVTEVETSLLNKYPVTDPHITSFRVNTAMNRPLWLRPSPEYRMKELLAAGSGDIFEIGKVFRDGETGRKHLPEFTMIEWYRLGFELQDIIDDTVALLRRLTADRPQPADAVEQMTYCEAFERYTLLNPLTASGDDFKKRAKSLLGDTLSDHLNDTFSGNRDLWLDLLMSHHIEQQFDPDKLTVITHYPADQAVLARIDPNDERVAERFEIYYRGTEVANGFRELTDAAEQRRRFEKDQDLRREQEQPVPKIDEDFLAALKKGLPECSGVAVGLDRLIMCAENLDSIG